MSSPGVAAVADRQQSSKAIIAIDTIGGAPAVHAAVDDFYLRVLADTTLEPVFKDVDMARLKTHQREFITAAIGGPQLYAGRDMALAHAGLHISDDPCAV